MEIKLKIKVNAVDTGMLEVYTATDDEELNLLWAVIHEDILFEGGGDYDEVREITTRLMDGDTVTFTLKEVDND